MKYVWFLRILIIFVVKTIGIWPLQGESNFPYDGNFNFPLSRMSKVCSFLAETCGKCTELKACFWCSDSGTVRGNCYARNDLVAKRRCMGKVLSSYWGNPCRVGTRNFYSNEEAERSVLIKLLLLLRKLRDSQSNTRKKVETKSFKEKERQNLALQKHVNLGDITRQELKNKIAILSNLSSSWNSSLQISVQNLSVSIGNSIANSNLNIHNHNQNISMNSTNKQNTTVSPNNIKNGSIDLSIHQNIYCYMNNQSSCFEMHACTWCDKNQTCCNSREKSKSKEKTVVVSTGDFSKNETITCRARNICDTCVKDVSCYWCETSSSCDIYPGVSYIADECNSSVHRKQCNRKIPVYVIALCIILVSFFVSVGYICVRKCYYFQLKPVEVKLEERPILFKQKNGRTVYQITESEEEDEEELSRSGKDSYTPSKVGAAPNNPAIW